MEIYTDRLKFSELTLLDISKVAQIAKDMAWNDTLNLLLRKDIDETAFNYFGKTKLYPYKQKLKDAGYTEKLIELYKKVPYTFILEDCWHINFPQLSTPFIKKAQEYVNTAIEKRKEPERQGYWLAIRERNNNTLIGVIALSTKVLKDEDGNNKIGHSGMFLHPDYQKRGIVSEANAVMIDFMYKYLFDEQGKQLSDNTFYYTTCHPLNIGSQKIQEKAGGILSTKKIATKGKFEFYATREQQENSPLFKNPIKWRACLDNGTIIASLTGKNFTLHHISPLNRKEVHTR